MSAAEPAGEEEEGVVSETWVMGNRSCMFREALDQTWILFRGI